MIKKARINFILLSLSSILALLTVLLLGMNLLNYRTVVKDADEILKVLSEHHGRFPLGGEQGIPGLPPHMSPELPYEARYFSVTFQKDGQILAVETSKIASVDREKAVQMAENALDDQKKKGFIGNYRYTVKREGDLCMIVFLDHGRKLDDCYDFLLTSITIATIGFLVTALAICFFAKRIVRPITESYEKQKRFITDAGHEIKTPLTIINANVDLLEMEYGKSESLDEVKTQSERLAALTTDLVRLARMEEAERSLQLIDFPVSESTEEVVSSFKALIFSQGKTLECSIAPMLTLKGDLKSYERLVSILMENAVKYSSRGGRINLSLTKHGRGIMLTVENDTDSIIDPKNFEHIFDRFYRFDSSRNSETGGHGIGLSLAYAIVSAHGGKITPFSGKEYNFGITVILP